jgi:gas vesicle structural protein
MSREVTDSTKVALVELLDRVIDRGVILAGDITISVADVNLIYLGLRVMLASVERMEGLRAEHEESRDA